MSFDFNTVPMEEAACPLCGGKDLAPLAAVDRYWMGVRTVACRACGMITTSPRPTEAALDAFYRDHYRTVYAKVAEPSLDYIRANGVDRRSAYVAEFLAAKAELGPSPQVLDVGCAEGSILRALRWHRPEMKAVGVEPGPKFADFAREHAACEVVPDLAAAPERPYDLILVNHVLEHVVEPIGFLRALGERLGPGGRLFVDVPDAAAYDDVDDLHIAHLHHYTATTLTRTAQLAGLRPALIERHRPPRHPASVRALFVVGEAGRSELGPAPEDLEAAERIRAIGRRAGWYRLRSALQRVANRLGVRSAR